MKNIKFKTALVALSLSAALALSATACSSKDDTKDDDNNKAKIEETEKGTEETTTEETKVEFSDPTVSSLKDEKEADGCTIEVIDAAYLGASDSDFVEGFKATGGSQEGEFVCAKFTDAEVAKTFVKETMAGGTNYSMSTFNNATSFVVNEETEGTIDKNGVMCYYPYSEESTASEDFFEISADDYSDPELKDLCQQYIDEGCTMMDAGEDVEGFIAYQNAGEESEGPLTLIECLKFDSVEDAKAYVQEMTEGTDAEFTEKDDGSFEFTVTTNMGVAAEGSVSATGLFIAKSVYG